MYGEKNSVCGPFHGNWLISTGASISANIVFCNISSGHCMWICQFLPFYLENSLILLIPNVITGSNTSTTSVNVYIHVPIKMTSGRKYSRRSLILLSCKVLCIHIDIFIWSIAEPPRIQMTQYRYLTPPSQKATLSCPTSGVPPPEITWFKGERDLTRVTYTRIWPNGDLDIMGVQDSDSGSYTCYATNEAGVVSETVHLEVGCKYLNS